MGFRLDFIKSHLLLLGLGLFLFGIVGVASSFHDVPTRSTCSHNKIFLQLTVHIPVDLIQIQRLNTQCQWHGHLLLAASTATAHGHLASLAILPAALSRDIKPIAVPQISAGLPLQGELVLNEQLIPVLHPHDHHAISTARQQYVGLLGMQHQDHILMVLVLNGRVAPANNGPILAAGDNAVVGRSETDADVDVVFLLLHLGLDLQLFIGELVAIEFPQAGLINSA